MYCVGERKTGSQNGSLNVTGWPSSNSAAVDGVSVNHFLRHAIIGIFSVEYLDHVGQFAVVSITAVLRMTKPYRQLTYAYHSYWEHL